jgi:hypothetical protein
MNQEEIEGPIVFFTPENNHRISIDHHSNLFVNQQLCINLLQYSIVDIANYSLQFPSLEIRKGIARVLSDYHLRYSKYLLEQSIEEEEEKSETIIVEVDL